jgi:hypothetical protein
MVLWIAVHREPIIPFMITKQKHAGRPKLADRKQVKVHLCIRVPIALLEEINRSCKRQGMQRNQYVREVIVRGMSAA